MPSFRNGQWVKFDNEIAGAHKAADGATVGLFIRGGTDGLGQVSDDRVMVCCPEGENIAVIEKGQVKNITLTPEEAVNLRAILEHDDIPAKRRATMKDDYVLKP
jgi:hypothetical protein